MLYSVVFKSVLRATGTTTNAVYDIDWSAILPENTAFKVSFTFVSTTVNITSLSSVPILQCQLGQFRVFRIMGASTSSTTSTNVLGHLLPPFLNTSTYLQADSLTNNPIYLAQRPSSNDVEITITSSQTGNFWVDNVGATIPEYDLVISFEEMTDGIF